MSQKAAGRPAQGGSLSVVIPARNEEGNLKGCVETVMGALEGLFDDYEIIIVDDGSADGTGALADRLASELPAVRSIHNPRSEGFAGAYRRGVNVATKAFVGLIPGDNEIEPASVRKIFETVGDGYIVVPFTANQQDRPWLRRALSRAFTATVNCLFGLRLRYFQGPCVYPAELIRRFPATTTGFAFLTEILVRILTAGYRAIEVPMYIQPRRYGASSAVSLTNVATTLRTLAVLLWDVKIRRRPLR